ncbi:MAG: hypothetical protein M3323_06890 [Actinomycetota bacterium]|nr:hypothetical protein [Actinomycetota bacterium]
MSQQRSNQAGPPPRPRWVQVSAIVAAVVVAVLLVLAIAGGHGPGRHLPGGNGGGGHTPPVQHSP